MRTKSPSPPTPADLEPQARRLRALLIQLSRRRPVRDPVASACEDLGLTPVQVHIVAWLGQDGPFTMGELARRVAVTEKTITGVVDRLERDDLVQRARDPADRRVIQVRLAPRGAALYRRIDAEIEAKLVGLLALLDPADRGHLVAMLEKLSARLGGDPGVDAPGHHTRHARAGVPAPRRTKRLRTSESGTPRGGRPLRPEDA